MRYNTNRVYIIAEVAQAHEGSVAIAHSYIDAAAKAGVDAVKFQTHFADAESGEGDSFRVAPQYCQDQSRYDYWKRMEFTSEQWLGLKLHCDMVGVDFISSAFSIKAFNLLESIGVELWKVPSGEIQNLQLLEMIVLTKKTVLISSGMSTYSELDQAINLVKRKHNNLLVMQCTSRYPCAPEHIGLNILNELKSRYGPISVGLSDHSGTIFPSLASVAMGAMALEVHVTFSRELFGFDARSSVTFDELAELVRGVRFIETAMNSPVDKDRESISLSDTRKLFQKSIFVEREILPGQTLEEGQLTLKKPGVGIPANQLSKVIGRIAKFKLVPGSLLKYEDLM